VYPFLKYSANHFLPFFTKIQFGVEMTTEMDLEEWLQSKIIPHTTMLNDLQRSLEDLGRSPG
jgi:hypothetical protein